MTRPGVSGEDVAQELEVFLVVRNKVTGRTSTFTANRVRDWEMSSENHSDREQDLEDLLIPSPVLASFPSAIDFKLSFTALPVGEGQEVCTLTVTDA